MGAEIAIHQENQAQVNLANFTDVYVAGVILEAGAWVIIGRATVFNEDGDRQNVTARLVRDANVIIDNVSIYAPEGETHCLAVQATLKLRRPETVTLMCNTFKGFAECGSLIAFKVDDAVP
jgi:hypothetical protein